MSKKGFFHSLRNIFCFRARTRRPSKTEEELFTRREDDIPAKRLPSRTRFCRQTISQKFLKFTDMRKPWRVWTWRKFVRNLGGKSGRFIFLREPRWIDWKKNWMSLPRSRDSEKIYIGRIMPKIGWRRKDLTRNGFKKSFDGSEAAISLCEGLIARSCWFYSRTSDGRTLNVFPPIHIVITRITSNSKRI